MTVLSYGQLEQLWIQNGGSKLTAPVAAAVAMAESSGRSDVTSSNPDGGVNVGPWQLDTRGKGAGYSVSQLQDPNINARLAVAGSSGGSDWSAWETFVTGAYKKFLQGNVSPSAVPPGTAGTGWETKIPLIGGAIGAAESTASFLGNLDGYLGDIWATILKIFNPTTYVRIAAGMLGVFLLAWGLFALGKAVL